jgi:hypothetical protein
MTADGETRVERIPFAPLLTHPLDVELEAWPLPAASSGVTVDGDPLFEGRILWVSDDGRRVVGIQRCGPCVMRGTHVDELSYFLEGSLTIESVGGEAFEVVAGAACVFPKGLETIWTVHDTFRKLFHLTGDDDLGYRV